jgi:hypothetical protein
VIVKVAKVGAGGESQLKQITRYTNSQNTVHDKDFLALTGDFRSWQDTLANKRSVYLESSAAAGIVSALNRSSARAVPNSSGPRTQPI